MKLHRNTIRLTFVREFTKGSLKGLQMEDSLPFVNEALAKEWLTGIERNSKKGAINYKVVSFTLSEIKN